MLANRSTPLSHLDALGALSLSQGVQPESLQIPPCIHPWADHAIEHPGKTGGRKATFDERARPIQASRDSGKSTEATNTSQLACMVEVAIPEGRKTNGNRECKSRHTGARPLRLPMPSLGHRLWA
eukprot:2245923-Amphidinium_carterae.1